MPTYRITNSSGKVVADGIASWAEAVRLADAMTRRLLDLCVVAPNKVA